MPSVKDKFIRDPEIGEVIFRKSPGRKTIGIRVHPTKGVTVSMPDLVPFAISKVIVESRRSWVIQTIRRQKERYNDVPKADPAQIESLRKQAKAILPARLKELADRYGFIYNRVAIKHNSTNWGSCSTKGNINLNRNIVRLPVVLQDYILLHELCHLRHHDHGAAFHLLLEHVLTDNLLKYCDAGDEIAGALARAAAVSKAKYSVGHVCTKAIKGYPLI